MPGKLYVVATPIGNASDISQRAKDILTNADLIAAEDTRTSSQLLNMLDIHTRLKAYHKFNEAETSDYFVGRLAQGDSVALITDAGTPCISDPGYILVKRAVEAGIEVVGISGPCAAVTALSVSGFNCISFSFYGFLPRAKKDILEVLERTKTEYSPVTVFYESPKRIIATFEIMSEAIPSYDICLCNDLTKLHERIYRGKPGEVLSELRANEKADKGEYTIVLCRAEAPQPAACDDIAIEARIVDIMISEKCSVKDAVSLLSKKAGISKKDAYAASLRLRELFSDNGEQSG